GTFRSTQPRSTQPRSTQPRSAPPSQHRAGVSIHAYEIGWVRHPGPNYQVFFSRRNSSSCFGRALVFENEVPCAEVTIRPLRQVLKSGIGSERDFNIVSFCSSPGVLEYSSKVGTSESPCDGAL